MKRPRPTIVQWYLIITILINLVFILSILARAQDVKPGQTVYVVASRTDGDKPDLAVEAKAKKEFQKKKKFELAHSATGADLVFILLTEYDSYSYSTVAGNPTAIAGSSVSRTYVKSITAIVVPAKDYAERKDDLEKLREVALWQGAATSGFREASTSNVVKAFHEYAGKRR
jgi:hypothetical protein